MSAARSIADLGIAGPPAAPVAGEAGVVGAAAVSGVVEGVGVGRGEGGAGGAETVGVPAGPGCGVAGRVPNA
jgi:hypothetical protein